MFKKKGFSLVEVMIIFVVMSAIVAAMMPSITMRSKSVPIKIARGAYICYMDTNGTLHEEVYNRLHQIKSATIAPGQNCRFFPVKQAAAYQITAIGAGAGGYDYSKLNNSDRQETTEFKMSEGYTGYGVSMPYSPFPHRAVVDDEMIGYLSDDDLWENQDKGFKLFKDELLRLAMGVPSAGGGGDVKVMQQSLTDCTCPGSGGVSLSYLREVLYTNATEDNGWKWQNSAGQENAHASEAVRQTYSYLKEYGSSDTCGVYSQKKDFCTKAAPMGWGATYYNCSTYWETVYGQPGGPPSSKKYWYDQLTMTDNSLTGYYALDGSSKRYQNVLKKFADNMKTGKCSSSGDSDSCTFATGSVGNGTTGSSISRKRPDQSINFGDEYTAYDGSQPNGRIAMKFPDVSNTTSGFKLIFQTKKAGAGAGAKGFISTRCGDSSLLGLFARGGYSSSYNTNNDPVMTDGSFSSSTSSYRPMLDIKTTLKHRLYKNGAFGGNGQVTVASKTFFEGSCDIKIGKPGDPHKGYNTDVYAKFIASGDGDTTMKCTDKFEVVARAGTPSLIVNEDDYVYTYENRNKTSYKTKNYSRDPNAEIPHEDPNERYVPPVALRLITEHGHSAGINFGMGGDGTRFVDKCIAPKGTFIVYLKNEFGGTATEKLKQEYVLDEDKQCYYDGEQYGTVMQNVNYTGVGQRDILSRFLDSYAAKAGMPGAVIITW